MLNQGVINFSDRLVGKRQLNQLIGFLDKGGAKDGLGGRSADSGLRAVRAKREADEAGGFGTDFNSIDLHELATSNR